MLDSHKDLAIASCILLGTTIWVIYSLKAGGILHGAAMWIRPYYYDLATRLGSYKGGFDKVDDREDICDLHDPNEEPLPAIRSAFGARATLVHGWPSTGGVWVHTDCYGVELDFLGLSRFEPSATERYSQREDDFCKRLERIGARFYESEYAYNSQSTGYFQESTWWYGWPGDVPTGGLWALRLSGYEAAERGVSRIRNALSMEERCTAIEMLGGGFYEKWEDIAEQ